MTDKATAPSPFSLSLYSRVGGMPFFERLVDAFYEGVAGDPVLAHLYPEYPDFSGARHRLTLFLAQYWGGPQTYTEERGHPRLRMRHLPFTVGTRERDHWLAHMASAVARVCDDPAIDPEVAGELMDYFVPAAEHMRNDTGLPITSASYPR